MQTSAQKLGITIRKKTRYPYAESLLRDWGVWVAKAVDGLGYADMSTIGRLIELGTTVSNVSPISPNYFPTSENKRAHDIHQLILTLPRDMQRALEAWFVHDYSRRQAYKVFNISQSVYQSLVDQGLAWITGIKQREVY